MRTTPPAIIVLAIALITLVCCRKEPTPIQPTTYTTRALNELSDAFDPPLDQIVGLIKQFNEKKRALAEGSREGLGEKQLSEALWMSEADLNFWRGDARILADSMSRDSIFFILPIHLKENGQLWVFDEDLIVAQQALLAEFPIDSILHPIELVDLSVKQIGTDHATIEALVVRRAVPPHGPHPPAEGCFPLHQIGVTNADQVMNSYLNYYAYYEQDGEITDWHPPFYATVSTQHFLGTLDEYGVLDGYVTYMGTLDDYGGPAWFTSGQAFTQVCFPDYWQRHLAMKQWYYSWHPGPPGRCLVEQHYTTSFSPRTGGPMSYGSLWYPMGPYDHTFYFKHAVRVRVI